MLDLKSKLFDRTKKLVPGTKLSLILWNKHILYTFIAACTVAISASSSSLFLSPCLFLIILT